jgi:cyclopropane fatty-acyl-phospholipid synthase-like methyltransferase
MPQADIRTQWEGAASGWARWEAMVAAWMEPAAEAMLTMAGVRAGARVLDLACGAGSQTLQAARRVGPQGHVVASDIATRCCITCERTLELLGSPMSRRCQAPPKTSTSRPAASMPSSAVWA